LDALSALASHNEVTLMWVPGHCGILGNEKADELARQGAAKPLLGPYLGVRQGKLLRTGLSANILLPGIIYQVTDMDHVRKTLIVCLN
jgi:hypothetical protein